MLIKVAWRNIWRSKVRSLVLITSIGVGLWAGTFILGFGWGLSDQRLRDAIQSEISHIQVHHPNYKDDDLNLKLFIPNGPHLLEQVSKIGGVMAASGRLEIPAIVFSKNGTQEMLLKGVYPPDEMATTAFDKNMVEGDFLGQNPGGIVIGRVLAEKLQLQMGDSIEVTFPASKGALQRMKFPVAGMYRTNNSVIDARNAYVQYDQLAPVLDANGAFHELAIYLHDHEKVEQAQEQIAVLSDDVLVESWKEISPELVFMVESFDQVMVIFIGIILLALVFGIINTMLMAVLERTKELGMLMAVGMSRKLVFLMVMLETVFIVLFGAPFGLLLAWATISTFGVVGIDMSMFAKGMSQYGMANMVYPWLPFGDYMQISLLVIVAAFLAAVYPAYKAIKLLPAEAIRKV